MCHHFTHLTILDPFSSFAARGHRKFGWKCPHLYKFFTAVLFIELKQLHLAEIKA